MLRHGACGARSVFKVQDTEGTEVASHSGYGTRQTLQIYTIDTKVLHVHDKLNEVYDFNKSAGVIGNGC